MNDPNCWERDALGELFERKLEELLKEPCPDCETKMELTLGGDGLVCPKCHWMISSGGIAEEVRRDDERRLDDHENMLVDQARDGELGL